MDFTAHAYVRARDGFLTLVWPLRAADAGRAQRVALLDPDRGMLRLANPGPRPAAVTVRSVDDLGARPGGSVRVLVPSGAADAAQR